MSTHRPSAMTSPVAAGPARFERSVRRTSTMDMIRGGDNFRFAGLSRDLDPTAHFLERLRIYHPIIAVLVGAGLFLLATYIQRQLPALAVQRAALALKALIVVQLVAGATNVALLAPVWMQLVHLLLADLVWIALVLLAGLALAGQPASESLAPRRPVAMSQPGEV